MTLIKVYYISLQSNFVSVFFTSFGGSFGTSGCLFVEDHKRELESLKPILT